MTRHFVHEDQDADVEIEGVVADRQTDLALLCVIPQGKRRVEHWVPKSQISDDSEVWEPGQSGKLVIKSWWAERAGLG